MKKQKKIISKVTIYDNLPGFEINNGASSPKMPKPITSIVKKASNGTKLKG